MAHRHLDEADPRYERVGPCRFRTRKLCEENYVEWQAARQVELAQRIVARGGAKAFRKDNTVFGQLVQHLAGDRAEIEGDAPFTRRIRHAVDTLASKGSLDKEPSDG